MAIHYNCDEDDEKYEKKENKGERGKNFYFRGEKKKKSESRTLDEEGSLGEMLSILSAEKRKIQATNHSGKHTHMLVCTHM